MKTFLLATAAVLALAAGSARAAEGTRMPPQYNVVGNPFPYSAPASSFASAPPSSDTGSQGYAGEDGMASGFATDQQIPPNNNEGPMQTANSLPPGFAAGQVTYLGGAAPAATGVTGRGF